MYQELLKRCRNWKCSPVSLFCVYNNHSDRQREIPQLSEMQNPIPPLCSEHMKSGSDHWHVVAHNGIAFLCKHPPSSQNHHQRAPPLRHRQHHILITDRHHHCCYEKICWLCHLAVTLSGINNSCTQIIQQPIAALLSPRTRHKKYKKTNPIKIAFQQWRQHCKCG